MEEQVKVEHLQNISCKEDLQRLTVRELGELAEEIRKVIINTVSTNGGHLSSNLGVVELSIALNRIFDFRKDKIVWDVGHQCYPHKLLTGRLDKFSTLRKEGGLSGFPRIKESEYDHFNTGHAGTSISAALGMAAARDIKKEKNDVIAVIGDGSMTSGLSFEGLNNAGASKKNIIVILNDNEMSISPNVGALSAHMNSIISGEMYNKMKKEVDHILSLIPGVGSQMSELAHRMEDAIKGIVVPGRIFEDFGFKYFGPIEGHQLPFLLDTIKAVRKLDGPRLIHVVTKKGMGYEPAEQNPSPFHGTGPFDVATGKKISGGKVAGISYTTIFGKTLVELAERNDRVVAITAAMRDGTGLQEFSEKMPERFFDVGIAEQHAVTFAAGLAKEGFRPVVAIYSTFLQRAYDQVVHDVCNMNLPVIFAIDRAGIVGDDGSTHQGVFDISYLRAIPNMKVMAPKDENELRHMLYTATRMNCPVAIRYPRGNGLGVPLEQNFKQLDVGRAELLQEGADIVIAAIGNQVYPALEAAERLKQDGIDAAVINARFIKPLDEELIIRTSKVAKKLLTVEESVLQGGFGSAVLEALQKAGITDVECHRLGVPDSFVPHATQDVGRFRFGLDADGIYKKALHIVHGSDGDSKSRPLSIS